MLYQEQNRATFNILKNRGIVPTNDHQNTQTFEIDRNFYLKINVRSRGVQLTFNGSIFHRNWSQLKLPPKYWRTLCQYQRLELSSLVFIYDQNSQAINVFCKLKFMRLTFQGIQKISRKICSQMVVEVKSLVECCYRFGLINLSTRFFFTQFLQQAKFKKQIFLSVSSLNSQQIYPKSNQINQEIQIQQLKQLIQTPVQICRIQKITDFSSIKYVPKQLQYGQKYVRNILLRKQQPLISSGGFFNIQKHLYKLYKNNDQYQTSKQLNNNKNHQQISTLTSVSSYQQRKEQYILDILVRKTLKNERKEFEANLLKITKQLAIVEQVQNKSHMIRYYENSGRQGNQRNVNVETGRMNGMRLDALARGLIDGKALGQDQAKILFKQQVFMQYHAHTLAEVLEQGNLSLDKIMQLCLQLLQAVNDLHQSHVIHRDIKPQNFLIDFSSNRTRFNLKVIDFSESAIFSDGSSKYIKDSIQKIVVEHIFQKHDPRLYGATMPYSPPECQKNRQLRTSSGVNSFKIDSWSVGMMLPEIYTQKKLINFAKPYAEDILKISRDSGFQIQSSRRNKRGFPLIQSLVNYLSMSNLQFDQSKRIEVKRCYHALKQVNSKMKSWQQKFKGSAKNKLPNKVQNKSHLTIT